MKWYFIRHGEIASNKEKIYSGRSEEPLTEHGCDQVRSACRELAELDIDAIYCSPLVRTRQTAQIIVDQLGHDVPVVFDESLNELKMGPWEGMPETEVGKQFPEEWTLWNRAPGELSLEGRETLQNLQSRVVQGLQEIANKDSCQSPLVITHVAIIRVITLYSRGVNLNQYKSLNVGNAEIFNVELDF